MSDCLFCKIISNEIKADIVYQDDKVLAFNDINPQAPTHVLIIPKKHISSLNDLSNDDTLTIGQLAQTAQTLAKQYKHSEDGYRLVMNCNQHGGQTVYHIHMHLLAGRQLTWPPG